MATVSEIKTQLRKAATRLQKAQSKFEHIAQTSRKEIASVLNRELQIRTSTLPNDELEKEKLLSVARLKAEKLLTDDEASDLMGILERYCDVLLEGNLAERSEQLDAACLEAISGVLAAAPRIDSSELLSLSQSFAHRYPELTLDRAMQSNLSPKIASHLHSPRPSQTTVDSSLVAIARSQGLGPWQPPQLLLDDRRQELIEILDTASRISIVDETRLRTICSHGIPDEPAWLRSRAWAVLLGTLPKDKSSWTSVKEREGRDYLGLADQILGTLSNMPTPSTPLSAQDRTLHQFSKDVESLPPPIRDALSNHHDLPSFNADYHSRIQHGNAVSMRISQLQGRSRATNLPEESSIPSITLDNPPLSPSPASNFQSQSSSPTTVLLTSTQTSNPTAACDEIILRLLYVHSTIHASHAQAMGPSPALAAIFAVVLHVVLLSNKSAGKTMSDADNMLAVEAEVFWLVEAIVGRVMELLEPEEEGESWAPKFSRMTQWADRDLWLDLSKKGLDPALPYYSYRWIPTLFTHALPVQMLLPVWDALFSATYIGRQPNLHETPPQSSFVYAVGTSMLIRARAAIFQSTSDKSPTSAVSTTGSLAAFWRRQTGTVQEIQLPHSPSPYSPVASPKTPLSPTLGAVPSGLPGWSSPRSSGRMTPGTASNVFLRSVKLLQDYDVDGFGGIERLLDTTWSLWRKWNREGVERMIAINQTSNAGLAAPPRQSGDGAPVATGGVLSKIGNFAWKGMTNELSDDSDSPPEEEVVPSKVLPPPEVTITSPSTASPSNGGLFSSFGGGLGSKLTETVWKGITNQVDTPDASPDVSPVPSSAASPILVAHDEKAPPLEKEIDMGGMGSSNSWSGDATTSWAVGYAEKWKDSDTAAALLRTGTNLRVKALDAWTRKSAPTTQTANNAAVGDKEREEAKRMSGPVAVVDANQGAVTPSNSSVGSWGEMFAKRGSLPLVSSWVGESRKKEESEKGPDTASTWESGSSKHTSYSPPSKPAQFRMGRDSMIGSVFGRASSFSSDMSHLPTAPATAADGDTKNPLQAALAALSGGPKAEEQPKRGPKPLLLNSSSLITPSGSRSGLHSRTPSRTPSRRPSPNPTPRIGDRTSLPTMTRDEMITPGASGVVSLRRGPITNPRTAGYPIPQRDGAHSSQASVSSIPTPPASGRAFSVDLGSDHMERSLRSKRSFSNKGGFLVDLGEEELKPVEQRIQLRDEGFQQTNSMGLREASPFRGRRYTAGEIDRSSSSESLGSRSKRQQTKPTPISTYPTHETIPEVAVITPQSGDKMIVASPDPMEHEGFIGIKESTSLHALVHSVEVEEAIGTVGGGRLSRSRTPLRRKMNDSVSERVPRTQRHRDSGRAQEDGSGTDRLSVARNGSGSDEGAKGSAEDIYDMY